MSEGKYWSNKKEKIDHLIEKEMRCINLIYEMWTEEQSIDRLEEISERHGFLLEQQTFWASRNNRERYLYDLREFSNWLHKFIGIDKHYPPISEDQDF